MSANAKPLKAAARQMARDFENFKKTTSASRRTKNYLSVRLEMLESNLLSMKLLFETLVSAELKEEDSKAAECLFDEVHEMYFEYKVQLLDELQKVAEANAINTHQNAPNTNKTHEIRLPTIHPPTFSGEYENWKSFHDQFVSLVHNNATLTNIEKLHYLKSCCKESASILLDHISVDDVSYNQAWELLKSRYDFKRILVNQELKLLFDLPMVRNESSRGIRELLDNSTKILHSLKNLSLPTEHWDAFIVFLLLKKLPSSVQSLWETSLGTKKEIPTFQEFSAFLETKFRTLEMVDQQQEEKPAVSNQKRHQKNVFHVDSRSDEQFSCKICHKSVHALRSCVKFMRMDVNARHRAVKQFGMCFNCLSYSHKTNNCPSNKRCHFCQKPHHSLLHFGNNNNINQQSFSHTNPYTNKSFNTSNQFSNNHTTSHSGTHFNTHSNPNSSTHTPYNTNMQTNTHHTQINPNAQSFQPTDSQTHINSSTNTFHTMNTSNEILLATAVISVKASNGDYHKLRALIDPGSQATFITEAASQILLLKKHRTYVNVSGLGEVKSDSCRNFVDVALKSIYSEFELSTKAFVFKTLTKHLPTKTIVPSEWDHIKGLKLADPSFYKPGPIDLLIGNDVFCDVVLPSIIRGYEPIAPIAQKTHFGWLVMGKVPTTHTHSINAYTQYLDIDTQLKRFWEIEESPFEKTENQEDVECEEHFLRNTKRVPGGRFEVSLPFKGDLRPELKSTEQNALRMFYKQEQKLLKNTKLHEKYNTCLKEYLELNQMEEVNSNDPRLRSSFRYVVPHHGVSKESSTTTKLRVVFNAAFKTPDGTSLNDHLLTGPKTQADITSIVLRWRLHKITFTADIEKMYRQIQIHPDDSYYQTIFWREDPSTPVKLFRIKVVMFGTAPAPYLANRTLRALASEGKSTYPLAAQMIREDMYIDDLVSGANTLEEAKEKYSQISNLLSSAGFHLRKWMSNEKEFLETIPQRDQETSVALTVGSLDHMKTLGLSWYPSADEFSFQNLHTEDTITKRIVLSTIARIFDPLGWIAPCVIKAKIIMQQLWLNGLSWDEPVPAELQQEWLVFREELKHIDQIRVPRWMNTQRTNQKVEIHGFSDASMKAYGAVIFLRVLDSNDCIHTHLLIAKTKVAPVNTISLPRLELCGAVMLAKLLNYIQEVLKFTNVPVFAWTDSTITLCWISALPSKWKTFIANRVTEIQKLTNVSIWRHVPTKLNPADLASRGILPSRLKENELWWKGPAFLQDKWDFTTPNQPTQINTEEERREIKVNVACQEENTILDILSKQSKINKAVRIISRIKRFIYNIKVQRNLRLTSVLSPAELEIALRTVIRTVQQQMFPDVFDEIKKTQQTKLYKTLNLFIDPSGIIRIGGRLENANLTFEQKHPIVVKPDHHFSKLIIEDAHIKTLHGGIQQVVSYIRNQFWIFNLKRTVRKHINRCLICFKNKPKPLEQLMGNLPAPRVNVSRPFTHTGVDYAGPILVKAWKGRGAKQFKGYFAIFICLSTKAIHLEAVTDLTTQAFVAAFRRFTSRRGICTNIYSDCGTNFKGASVELQRMLKEAKYNFTEIADTLSQLGTNWNFIPPASPHFGGLWEAGVKSVKFHLNRVAHNQALTFEELSTLLSQIEACLNSRPLCPLTDSLEDFNALTPAHFLIGTSVHIVPERDLAMERIGYLDRWKRIQASLQTFWKEWSGEYLTRLQNRPKWLKTENQPRIGDLVLLKDERLPPSKWSMARIIKTYQGQDQLIRVVKVRTPNTEMKRPITKICPLPSNVTMTEDSIV